MSTVLATLGRQLKAARKRRGLSQTQLAERVGRSFSRVSELERDLAGERWGRDRLTLFAEICDTLDLAPVLVPRASLARVEQLLDGGASNEERSATTTAFDDLFVDLNDDENR